MRYDAAELTVSQIAFGYQIAISLLLVGRARLLLSVTKRFRVGC